MPKKQSRKKKETAEEIVEGYYQKIDELNPTYKEIESFTEKAEKERWSYGVVTYTKRDGNPLTIRFHDTWRQPGHFGGRIHIDIISGRFHLMLDKNMAPVFLDFIKKKREIVNKHYGSK